MLSCISSSKIMWISSKYCKNVLKYMQKCINTNMMRNVNYLDLLLRTLLYIKVAYFR
uniref:Uncharacterized protein n=1 Tax=Octopus bimaculoides TaxID=37653 RepID=A0A0L8HSA9_OCTBM